MARSEKLRRSLKAADRRRSRRSETQAQSASDGGAALAMGSSCSNQFDVAGLCVEEILKLHERTPLRDSEVISALRSVMTDSIPASAESQLLVQRFAAIGQQDEVTKRSYSQAISSLLTTAQQHRKPDDDSVFVRFLTVLAN